MSINRTSIRDCFILEYKKNLDERGSFYRVFSDDEMSFDLIQSSIGYNKKARTARGLHLQNTPSGESKIITCVSGSADVFVVDCRKRSASYMEHIKVGISSDSESSVSIVVPKYCASGYITKTDHTSILYYMNDMYSRDHSVGYSFLDTALCFGYDFTGVIMSDRDRNLPFLSDVGGID